ncbi:hypothetical protein [Treponema denticola]|uniref:hypothetical protein n=1 Tax=Treponema denticola TaxID=158 RepID=UPI0002B515FB|nr:hypothetical protein [Treponema denticola]EMB20972.1 hypothetical protein HMPREF9724_02109 [Treponema denticola SP37]EPF33002.1 hypothetical protein HMPREF9734_02325 [Treponema denticola SP44]EPF40480.1 hypothetical protein HMPREF9731_00342 [Treponema denticola SP23]
MALDFNKIEEPDDSVFPVKLEDDSNLDMYGVWIKKRPEHKDGYESVLPVENENAEDPFGNDILEFDDHDIINLDNSDEPLEFEELTTLNNFETIDNEANKTEEHLEDLNITSEDDIYGDEFDIFDEADAVVIDEDVKDSFDIDLDVMPKVEEETASDINEFETLDLDDFLSDSEALESTDKNENKNEDGSLEPDNNIKLDLSFDEDYLETKGSDAIDFEGNESFEITSDEPDTSETSAENKTLDIENLPERKIDDISDFDEILDELEADSETDKENVEELTDEIPLNITVDEYSDISSLAGKTMGTDDDLEDVEIFSGISEFEEAKELENTEEKKKEDDGLVIESTIIEAGNIDEIRKENQKIMADSSAADMEEKTEVIDDFDSMLDSVMGESSKPAETGTVVEENDNMFFDDIEALENDLLDSENQEIPEEFTEDLSVIQSNKKNDGAQTAATQSNMIANDKATEILTQIASELVDIKNELANMKFEMAQTQQKLEESKISASQENTITGSILNDVAESDKTGFFNDDDGDETIALTGDELNNILITADFTEENTEKDYEIPETLDEIDEAFLDDDNIEKDTKDEPEVFADDDLLNAVEPEHINDLTDDISYLDEDVELHTEDEPDEKIEEIEIEDFLSDDTEEPALEDHNLDEPGTDEGGILDDFDMPITELELPDGQSIPLGDEYSGFEAITEKIEEGRDEASDFEDAVFSPEELDQAAKDIPRLELNESAAEEQKVQTETLPIHLKDEIKSVLTYMDQLLESLPEEKIEEFAKSEYFDTYKRLFDELGIS